MAMVTGFVSQVFFCYFVEPHSHGSCKVQGEFSRLVKTYDSISNYFIHGRVSSNMQESLATVSHHWDSTTPRFTSPDFLAAGEESPNPSSLFGERSFGLGVTFFGELFKDV